MDSDRENSSKIQMTKPVIIKNVTVLCIGVILIFTAYSGLAIVQSTMNNKQGIGVISQAIIYAGFCLSSLLFPKYVITKLGSKRTFALSMLTYVPYIAANFYPYWGLMIPSSICIGLGASLLWGSQANYLNDISGMYALLSTQKDTIQVESTADSRRKNNDLRTGGDEHSKDVSETLFSNLDNFERKDQPLDLEFQRDVTSPLANKDTDGVDKTVPLKVVESTTALIFGFHGLAFVSTQVWTNLLTYFVLRSGASGRFGNTTCVCGADFCNVESECFVSNVDPPSDSTRYLLTGVCTALALLSVLVVAVFLDPLETDRKEVRFSLELMSATCRFMKKKEFMLLIPYSSFIGLVKGFYIGDFTKSYIGCAWGTYHVGLVSVFYGLSSGLSSSLSGWLVKRFGRLPVFSAAAALNLAACLFLLLWTPDRRDTAMFFLAAVLWGMPIGILWSQFRALFGMLFKADEEAAFAAFHAWYSLGFCLSFAYSNYLCTYLKIYLLLAVSTLGYAGYVRVETMQRLER